MYCKYWVFIENGQNGQAYVMSGYSRPIGAGGVFHSGPYWCLGEAGDVVDKLNNPKPQPAQPAPSTWTDLDVRTAANAAANEISKAGLTKLSVLEIAERVYKSYKFLVGDRVLCRLAGTDGWAHDLSVFHPPTNQNKETAIKLTANALNAQADLIKSRGAYGGRCQEVATMIGPTVKPSVVMLAEPSNRHLQAALDQTVQERDTAIKDLKDARSALPRGFDNTRSTLAECIKEMGSNRNHYEGLFNSVIRQRNDMWWAIPEDIRHPLRMAPADDMHKAVAALVSQRDQARKELEEISKLLNDFGAGGWPTTLCGVREALKDRKGLASKLAEARNGLMELDRVRKELEEANREIERVRVQRNGYIKALDETNKNHAFTLDHVRDAMQELKRGQERGCPYQGITLALKNLQSTPPF